MQQPGKSLGDMPSRTSAVSDALTEICKNVEPDFLRIGQELQSLHAKATQLTQQTVTTVNLIGGESDQGLLEKTETLAKGSLAALQTNRNDVYKSLEEINTVALHLGSLYSMCSDIEKIARSLRIVGLNIGVESTRSTDSNEMFSVVAQEIKALSDQIIAVSESIRYDSKSARDNQTSKHRELTETLNRLQDVSISGEAAVRDAVQRIEEIMALTLQTLAKSKERTQKISRQISEIVVGIQFHDNMRQRSEHIIEALGDVGALCSAASATEGLERPKRLGSAHTILNLQTAQLKQVISETDSVYRNTVDAFAELGNEIGQLVETASTLGVETTAHDAAEDSDPFLMLKTAFETLHVLFDKGERLIDKMHSTAVSASNGCNRLSSHVEQVRKIGFVTRINALNAIVKAAHLGEQGITLEVLAQEMSRLSNEANRFVDSVVSVLDTIATAADTLTQNTLDSDGDEQSSDDKVKTSLAEGIQEISRTYERFKEESMDASRRSEALQAAISAVRQELGFFPLLSEKLSDCLSKLDDISQELSPWAGAGAPDHLEGLQLSRRYTMAEERMVHEETLEAPSVSARANDSNTQSASIGQSQDGDCEMWVEGPTEPPPEKAGEEDLGDNVELF